MVKAIFKAFKTCPRMGAFLVAFLFPALSFAELPLCEEPFPVEYPGTYCACDSGLYPYLVPGDPNGAGFCTSDGNAPVDPTAPPNDLTSYNLMFCENPPTCDDVAFVTVPASVLHNPFTIPSDQLSPLHKFIVISLVFALGFRLTRKIIEES